jgi:AhpD family alkylhydroperoxidase
VSLRVSFWFGLLQYPDVAHLAKNCGERDDKQPDNAQAENDGEKCEKDQHSQSLIIFTDEHKPGRRNDMSKPGPIEYADGSGEVRAVYDDIKTTRNVPDVNNFWKYLANDPKTLKRTWESIKEVMAPGALDPLVKEMVYLAVSVTNGCGYCTASHSAAAAKAGMTPQQFAELMAVVGMANETNRLANGYRVPIDPAFES